MPPYRPCIFMNFAATVANDLEALEGIR